MPRLANTKYDRKILFLYRQEYSAKDVAGKLRIPLHRIYDSLIRQKISRRNMADQHRIRFAKVPLSFRFRQKFTLKQRELLVAGAMLYYGEGAKTGHGVDFANSTPATHQIFLKFLLEICGISNHKLRFYLYCFDDQNPAKLIRFWCRTLNVSKKQFTKPYVRNTMRNNQRVMENGVLHIRYSDKRLLHKILALIAEIASSLI